MIPLKTMAWMARHWGQRVEWNGPTVFGAGYLWCGKIYWDIPANS